MGKKHILVISQYFYPEQFRINDICTEWIKRGYKVSVITGIPNYPEGKFYNGYGFLKRRKENYNGVEVYRLPLIPRGNNSIMLILNYLSFVISGFFWKIFTKTNADYVFIFEVSPMTQALPGVWYAKKRKIPCYLYVQDLWPENVEIVAGITNKYIIKSIEKMVDYIYRYSDKIFTTSPSFVEAIISRDVDESKVEYWPQYAESFYKPLNDVRSKEIVNDGRINIIFTGNIGYAQGLELLPKAANILQEKGYGDKVRFNIVGDGRYKQELINIIKRTGLTDMFNLIDRKPPEEIPALLNSSDVAFLSFANNELFNKTIPAKLQSYLACGIPIIASAGGESKRIIEEAKSGYCTETGNAEKLTESILKFINLDHKEKLIMRKNARTYYESHFDKEMLLNIMDKNFY